MNKNILIADDDTRIAELVEVYLKNEGYTVIAAYDGEESMEIARKEHIDLAIIDIMMPKIDGFELCRKLRKTYNFPIIILSAKPEYSDKINGLTLGADDYIVKPFHPLELVARVKAQLRRTDVYNVKHVDKDSSEISHRGIIMNRSSHRCIFNGEDLKLTPTEFEILWMLCSEPGKVFGSEEIFQRVWKEKYYSGNKTVMVHIRHIREKMNESPGKPNYIKTVWGVGYKID